MMISSAKRCVCVAGPSVVAALALAACGSSSSSNSSSSTTTAKTTSAAVAAKGTPVRGVASPKGAVSPKSVTLAKLVAVHQGLSARLKGLDNVPIAQAIPTLSGDLNQFWSQEFAKSGVQWPTSQDVLVQGSSVQTPCSSHPTVAPTDPMLVCAGTQTAYFYWTVPWMQQNVDTDPGGVTLALAMAGQYAFDVQDLFSQATSSNGGQLSLAQQEQQNICLTGIYAKSVNDRGLIEQADLTAFKGWLNTINGGSDAGAATNQQLTQAFAAGYNSGMPSSCGVGSSGTQTTPTSPTTTTTTTT